MEFQLNKIDTNVRRKLQEKTRHDKVHSKYGVKISVNADKEKKENENDNNESKHNAFSEELSKAKKIKIKAERKESIHVKTTLEAQTDNLGKKEGFYIDTRK